MKHIYKRVVAMLLCLTLVLSNLTCAFADTPGGSQGSELHTTKPGGAGYSNATEPVFRDYGFRVTMTTGSEQLNALGIEPLKGAYTKQQLIDQRNLIKNYNLKRYWEPGNYGLYYWRGLNGNIHPNIGITSSYPGDGHPIRNFRMTMQPNIWDQTAGENANKLAGYCYSGIPGLDRTTATPYNETMGKALVLDGMSFATGDDYLYFLKTTYMQAEGIATDQDFNQRIVDLMQKVISTGDGTKKNLQYFSWDSDLYRNSGDAVTAQDMVRWSRIGYLTTLIQFAWVAQAVGDDKTFADFRDLIWGWVSNDFAQDSMPILDIEACEEVSVDGTTTAAHNNCQLVTLPWVMSNHYGVDVTQQLYQEWPAEAQGNLQLALSTFIGDRSPVNASVVGQGLGYYISGSQVYPRYPDRAFFQLLWPTDNRDATYGYIIGYTYSADCPDGDSDPPGGTTVPGSFTWKLDPKGIHDVTPDEEVNASSTVYDINMSQAGYNNNNYDKWEAFVNSQGQNKNKVRMNIYRISQTLPEDTIATGYERNQVKAAGSSILEPVDRVVRGDLEITNIPVLGKLKAGDESRELTNEEFLTIMKTATGMSYNESIVGPLKEGIRVTYAVFIDVKVGNNSWQSLTNNQTEYVEYRSNPGTYSFQSDAPDGYAEIKCGYFDKDRYEEPFEAMAGAPTTENLYFVSGGQEFVAQLKYEYTTDKEAIREYEQKYSTEECTAYWTPVTKTFTDVPVDEVNQWLRDNTDNYSLTGDFITASICDECGQLHTIGEGDEDHVHTSISGNIGDDDKPKPGKYYTEIDLHATHWDWHCDGDSDSHEEPGDPGPDGEETTVDVPCETPSGDVADSATQPPDETCDYDGSHHASYYKVRATRYSGTVKSYHTDYNNNNGHKTNTASIKWTQKYKNMNYAKIKSAHVWRLEKSRVEGIKQLTFKTDDFVLGTTDELANVIFNVAEEDNAKEGRMWYYLHPENDDHWVANKTLKTRGCCHCFNHNAAEDMIDSAENPNDLYEQAWCISDYLVLDGYNATTSLLYYQYETKNSATVIGTPILRIKTSGTGEDNRKDNGYIITINGADHFRGYDDRGQYFESEDISYTTAAAQEGSEEAVCQGRETYVGYGIASDDLSWAGYNGSYSRTTTDLANGTDDPAEVGKYRGKGGANNFASKRTGKIFQRGYQHNNQGEVNGFTTSSPQKYEGPDNPFVLCVNDIDMDDFEVHNGTKEFHDSTIFYHNIITYGPSPLWSVDEDDVYKDKGFHVDTSYYGGAHGINDINVHDPVSAQDAKIVPLPTDLDQRVYDRLVTDDLNTSGDKCPGKANACKYAHIACEYAGDRYHTDDCYVKVRGQGLATIPVTGGQTTTTKPIYVPRKSKGTTNFEYSGGTKTFTAPEAGYYSFKLYGAEGGWIAGTTGGKHTSGLGGYTYADVYLTKGQVVTVVVGGRGGQPGGGYNGGGYGGPAAAGGGGATDIRINGTGLNDRVLVAGGGGGDGCGGSGGAGGGTTGEDGKQRFGTPGKGGTQTAGGAAGRNYGTAGSFGQGGNNTVGASISGGGGGGGGWYGGGGGGNDYRSYDDRDDSGGGGGSGHIATGTVNGNQLTKNGTMQTGVRAGNGYVSVSWDIDTSYTEYVPSTSGNYKYDNSQATVYNSTYKPQIYTATFSGYHSIHLFGGRGGGNENGKESAGGLGGYAAGQIYLSVGEKLLVTVGDMGNDGSKLNSRQTSYTVGGYNGGGWSKSGFGGGGATDVVKKFTYYDSARLRNMSSNGVLQDDGVHVINGASINVSGLNVQANHTYRVDIVGSNLTAASVSYPSAGTSNSYISSAVSQTFIKPNGNSNNYSFQLKYNGADFVVKEIYVIDLADRLLVAGGGGGADSSGGTLNGAGDGRGGKGGGYSGTNGLTNGQEHYLNAGAQAASGYSVGYGEPSNGKAGGGGGGWYGGAKGHTDTSGGGGGSSYLGKTQYSTTNEGQNSGAGYAVVILPGMGNTEYTHMLSCNEPHHAPNSNWRRYTDGWKHEGGYICTGPECQWCAKGVPVYSPIGFKWTEGTLNADGYIIKHDGKYHLTSGQDNHCDQCGEDVTIETYTLNNVDYHSCVWKTTSYDAPVYNTANATNPDYHYAFGDEICYDACMDDDKHRVNDDLVAKEDKPATAGQFVILDHDFQVYFPNVGDFYGNGALAIRNTQKPEGWGYIDRMDTTPWIREKYVVFPFDVTYKGTTYRGGEKVYLGYWDTANKVWVDDKPGGGDNEYLYDFHCLLENLEMAASEIDFTVKAINTPTPNSIENRAENRNYTRYGKTYRAYHDASRNYFIDVVGRIGVLSMLDTGDFRFSNYYKQVLDSWKVEEVVHDVDVSKQNNVSVDQKTIFGEQISDATKGQNTWGLTDWLEPMDKLQEFPLTPGKNNVPALRNQAHRIGYADYLSLVTIGNYYGENTKGSNNNYRVQIQPFYYYYNLTTKEWTPVDVYIKLGDQYKMINKYGNLDATTEYNYYYNLNWEAEKERRMYTAEEEEATRRVQDSYYTLWDENSESQHINIPHGITSIHGTANMLFLRDGNRTFIGTRYRQGVNTEPDNVIPEVNFNRQAQRWHFTLGLPSTAAFVEKGQDATPENMKKFDMDKGIIVCALEIYSRGTVWTLKYSGVPAGERSFYLFDRNTTLVSWEDAGDKGPQDKVVVTVYTDSKTSRNDLVTRGTH